MISRAVDNKTLTNLSAAVDATTHSVFSAVLKREKDWAAPPLFLTENAKHLITCKEKCFFQTLNRTKENKRHYLGE